MGPKNARIKPNSYPRPGATGNTTGIVYPQTDPDRLGATPTHPFNLRLNKKRGGGSDGGARLPTRFWMSLA